MPVEKKNNDQEEELEIEIVDKEAPEEPPKAKEPVESDDDDDSNDDVEQIATSQNADMVRQYSQKVQRRIDKLTKKNHDARREADSLRRELDEQAKAARFYVEESNRLKDLIARGEKVMIGEAKSRVEAEIARAQQELRQAHEIGDVDAITKAQTALSSAMAQRERVNTYQPQPLPKTQLRAPPQQPDPRAQSWHKDNEWFGRDQEMTRAAFGEHHRLVAMGVRPDSDEYYKEIDASMRRQFPTHFKGREPEPKPNGSANRVVVAPATRGGVKGRKVTLTPSQVRIAERFGLTHEQYARELLKQESI